MDYSKTVIYLIEPNDKNVSYAFVGSTIAYRQSKLYHKRCATQQKNCELYNTINENGGWDNWTMTPIENFTECKNKNDAINRVNFYKTTLSEKCQILSEKCQKPSEKCQKSSENVRFCQKMSEMCQKNQTNTILPVTEIVENIETDHNKTSSLSCPHCGSSFSRTDNLKRHIKNKHSQSDTQSYPVTVITNTTNNNMTNNLTVNNTVNNHIMVQLGNETIIDNLSQQQKHEILGKMHTSLMYYIHKVHFSGEYPQYMNAVITNIRSKYAYKYSEQQQKFIAELAQDVFSEMVDVRFHEICDLYDECKLELTPKVESKIVDFIGIMKNQPDKYKKTIDDTMLLAYNNKDKVNIVYKGEKRKIKKKLTTPKPILCA